ncbi:hypothetical protein FD754_001808, partial [Muntiacus muntjak]
EVADGLCLEVEGKLVSSTEGNVDDSLIDGNVNTGVNIVFNHHFQETSFTKRRLQETRKVKPFMAGATEQIKPIVTNFKNRQSFTGGNTNPMVVLPDL